MIKYNLRNYKLNSVFIKIIISLMAFSIVLILATNYIIYNQSTAMLREQTYNAHLNMLSKTGENIDQIFSQIEELEKQLEQNSAIINAMVVPGMHHYARNHEIVKYLQNIVSSNEYIHSIYVYVPYNNAVFSSSGGIYELKDFYDNEWIYGYNSNPDSVRQYDVRKVPDVNGVEMQCVTVFKDFPNVFRARLGQIIINLDADKLYNKMQAEGINLGGEIFALDEDGKIMLHQDKSKLGKNLEQYGYMLNIQGHDKGYLLDKIGSTSTLLFYISSVRTGWKFIYSIPLGNFGIDLNTIIRIILINTTICIMLSLLLSFFITKKIYNPVQRLIALVLNHNGRHDTGCNNNETVRNEYDFLNNAYTHVLNRNSDMEAFFDSVRPVIKEKLFTNILMGKKINTQEILEKINFLGIGFSMSNFIVMVIQIDNYSEFCGNCDEIQKDLYMNSLIKQIEETTIVKYKCVCVEVEEEKVAVIINFNEDASLMKIKEESTAIANDIKSKIESCFPFTVTLGIGRLYKSIDDISLSYKEAKNALNYKLYLGKNKVIDIENVELQPEDQLEELYHYYSEKEKLLINKLKVANKKDVINVINQLFEDIESGGNLSYTYVRQALMRIISLMIELIIESGKNVKDIFGEKYDLYKEFSHKETIADIKSWLIEVSMRIIDAIDDINISKKQKHIQKIKDYIQENSSSDISLNDIAEHIGLNPAYLSKMFKESFGQNFIDYLNKVRINKAKQLLESTQLSIKDIGFKVGFNTIQNFMRAFKKYEGITPGQYRQSM